MAGNGVKASTLRRLDYRAPVLLAVSIITILLAVNPIGKGMFLCLCCVWLVSTALFSLTELYWAPEPIFPIQLLIHRDVITSYLIVFWQDGAQISVNYCHFNQRVVPPLTLS